MAQRSTLRDFAVLVSLIFGLGLVGIGAVAAFSVFAVYATYPPFEPWLAPPPTELPERLHAPGSETAESWKPWGDRYNAACALAEERELDGAFFWLQESAMIDGVDAKAAHEDRDLIRLWGDERWPEMSRFLIETDAYWGGQDLRQTPYVPASGPRALVWLHGMGAEPRGLVSELSGLPENYGVSIVGVSGTRALGPNRYHWSEDIAADHAQVQEALATLPTPPTEVLLIGFSQGGQLSAELVAAYPDDYRGAIVISPGFSGSDGPDLARPVRAGADHWVTILVGEGEHPGNVSLAERDASWLRAAGVDVGLRLTVGQDAHQFPDDFADLLEGWLVRGFGVADVEALRAP